MNAIRTAFVMGGLLVTVSAQGTLSPARYRNGPIPSLPVLAVGIGGGQLFLELAVSQSGSVAAVRPLRTTAGFTELTVGAVQMWQFVPAEERVEPKTGATGPTTRRVDSKVLVVAMFRPPTLQTPTLGEPIRNVALASDETPLPVSTTMPPFPPLARNPGVVLVEARVDGLGMVVGVKVLRSAPPFDGVARNAARQWKFRPSRIGGKPVTSFVYILFGFPVPLS